MSLVTAEFRFALVLSQQPGGSYWGWEARQDSYHLYNEVAEPCSATRIASEQGF